MQTDSPTQGVHLAAPVDADAKPTSSAPFTYERPEPKIDPRRIVGSCHIFAVGERSSCA